MQKPQVTEIKVRMDCNGCVQKIKKALQVVSGKQFFLEIKFLNLEQIRL